MSDSSSPPAPIQVLAIIEAHTVTGPAKNLIAAATAFAQAKHPAAVVRVVTFVRGPASDAFLSACRKAGVEVEVIRERRAFDFGVVPQLRRIILKYRPDVVQTHNIKSHFLVRLAGVRKSIPWIAFHHGHTAENLKMRLYNQLDRWSLPGADRVATVCGAFVGELRRVGVDEDRLAVLHNAVAPFSRAAPEEVAEARLRLGIPPGALVLLSVGRLSAEKAHCDLVRAVGLLRRDGTAPEFRLVLIGAGPEEERIRELRRTLEVEDLVIMAGTTANVALYYSMADVFVLSSHSEGSPNALLEAMAAGLPVVATAVGGVPEIVQDGDNCLLVAAQDIPALCERILDLLRDADLRQRLGESARKRVQTHHSRQSYVAALLKLYQQVVPKRNILLVIDSLVHRGGTEGQLLELVSHVDRTRFRLHVCCFEDSVPPLEVPAPHRVLILPLTRVNSSAAVGAVLRLRKYIALNRIDLVQTFMFKASVIGVLAALRTRCRVIITGRRNMDFAPGHPRIAGFLNRRTTRILANSEAVKSGVVEVEGVSPVRIDVLYNGVDLDRFAATPGAGDAALCRLGLPAGAAVVGIVASHRPVKDIPLFLRAAQIVARSVPEAVFLLVGNGPLRTDMEALAAQLGIREKVSFAGAVDVTGYLACMRVGCLSSQSEGFSNAILEYMAAGVPVVATAVGGNAEAVVHGVTGYLVTGRNPEEFAGYIVRLLRHEDMRAEMGRRGYARCREVFAVREMVRRHEEYWAQWPVSRGNTDYGPPCCRGLDRPRKAVNAAQSASPEAGRH